MGKNADSREVAPFDELLRACLYEQEALRRVLVRKGLISNGDVLLSASRSGGKRGSMVYRQRARWQSVEG